jgi:hypothetical protein
LVSAGDTSFEDRGPSAMPVNERVVVILRGGLANQMFQYALGLAMAEQSGCRLEVDTSAVDADRKRDYALGMCNPVPRLVSDTDRIMMRFLRSTPLWTWRGTRWQAAIPGGPRIVQERGPAFDARVLAVEGSLILDGYWQTERYFSDHRPLIEQTFDWAHAAKGVASDSMIEMIESPRSVAVHVRRGDYVRETTTNAFHGVCEPDYYTRASAIILEHVTQPHFFIFSDDIDWAEANVPLPGERTVVRHARAVAPHVDMWLMSRCRHAIIANSSYSWWAAWLTERPGKCIVAPRAWFRDESMRGITPVPDRWQAT